MDTPQSGQPDEPPYRSFEDLQRDGVRVLFSPAAQRLFWPLDGVFPAAIYVMKTPRSADDLEPFFQPNAAGDGSGIWHEISQLPLTEPKVSSVEASVRDLEQWEYDWIAWHSWHKDHNMEGQPQFGQEFVTYGNLDDDVRPYADDANEEDGSWEEDSDTEFLIRCCGEDRPLRKRGQKLAVTPSAGSESFVTVQDYVSAVHPWLMSLRGDILSAKTVARPQQYPAPASMKWMVKAGLDRGPEPMIEEKKYWVRKHGGGQPRVVSTAEATSNARILERIRAMRNR
ncbi:hypothetical protein B0T17DRAFT_535328 [Bombardia bombarda]|uniref:Uncharacterized protein n=1 Tax=Bombardia bombarda TaxID=252184 RepID=A0AA39WUL8_9PEZI|nr:hypothetical protein B0T17DRAFT_535328 [Bombardia bombarda]